MRYEPITILYVVPVYRDRADYEAKTGKQAPAFDQDKPIKRWEDPAAPASGSKSYQTVNLTTGNYEAFAVSGDFARAVNLPGLVKYPKLEPEPTKAIELDQPIDPRWLISREEAERIMREIGGVALVEYQLGQWPGRVSNWNGETRRRYAIQMRNGNAPDAALLRNEQFAHGVGAPGRWSLESAADPVWAPERAEEPLPNHPETPIPMRTLREGEGKPIRRTPMSPLEIPIGEPDETTPGGGFTVRDRAMLTALYEKLLGGVFLILLAVLISQMAPAQTKLPIQQIPQADGVIDLSQVRLVGLAGDRGDRLVRIKIGAGGVLQALPDASIEMVVPSPKPAPAGELDVEEQYLARKESPASSTLPPVYWEAPKPLAERTLIFLNGLLQRPGADYKLVNGAVVPLWSWPRDEWTLVTAVRVSLKIPPPVE